MKKILFFMILIVVMSTTVYALKPVSVSQGRAITVGDEIQVYTFFKNNIHKSMDARVRVSMPDFGVSGPTETFKLKANKQAGVTTFLLSDNFEYGNLKGEYVRVDFRSEEPITFMKGGNKVTRYVKRTKYIPIDWLI